MLNDMKIGVYFRDARPSVGGGYTFCGEIFTALTQVKTKHSFFIFGKSAEGQIDVSDSKHINYVSLSLYEETNRQSTVNRWKKHINKILNRDSSTYDKVHPLKNAVDDLGIDIMWFVGPDYIEIDIPFIFTVWDLQHRLQPWFPEVSSEGIWRNREHLFKVAIRRSFAVIVGTNAGKEEVINFYHIPADRVKVIPHPTPKLFLDAYQDKSDKNLLAKYNIPAGYLLYPAQFWPHKNHVALLLAIKILSQKKIRTPVVFVGSDRGNLNYIKQLVIKLDLFEQVYFLGFVPQDDLIDLYRNAFALAYLSYFGPENLPPLEAFAIGIPVIASDVSGAGEQLGDAALLVDPSNEEQIADAIYYLHENQNIRQTLIGKGFKRAVRCTGKDYVEKIIKIIDGFSKYRRCWSSENPYQVVR